MKKQYAYLGALTAIIVLSGAAMALPAYAENGPTAGVGMRGMRPGAFGTVTAVNGSTITITSKNPKDTTTATFTVDATNAKVEKAGAASSVSAIAIGDTIAVQGTTNGSTIAATSVMDGMMGRSMGDHKPGVMGAISAISGNTITVTAKTFQKGSSAATTTTYTVDATNAKVEKANAASTVSALAIGDSVMIEGTTSGTTITATSIRAGMMMKPIGSTITGNGQPVVAGKVTAISGSSITIANKSNVSYSIDASSATIEKAGSASSVSAIASGDMIVAQGTINGTAVVASSVIDQGAAPASTGTAGTQNGPAAHPGIFGRIGSFFSKLFGF